MVRAVVMEGVRVVAVRAGVARAEVVRVVARGGVAREAAREETQEPRAAALMERSEPPRKHMQPRATHGAVPSGF